LCRGRRENFDGSDGVAKRHEMMEEGWLKFGVGGDSVEEEEEHCSSFMREEEN
jgi:hypothetical protein